MTSASTPTTDDLVIAPDVPGDRRDPWAIASAVVSAVLTLVVVWPIRDAGRAALHLVWRPSGDWALITLRVEDVLRSTPLTGPYSRFGWNHPGPLLYWLLAAPYHLLGDRPESVLAAAATLNAIAVLAIGWVAWRRGRLPLVAIVMTGLAIVEHAVGPQILRDPWNPFITLLPLALFVLLAWSLVERDHWAWPALAFVGSFLLQSHVGYLPMLVLVGAAIAALWWWRRHHEPTEPITRRRRRAITTTTIAVLVACWMPVVVDQFVGTGNLTEMFRYFTGTDDATAGPAEAFRQMARQLSFPSAPWLGDLELAGSDGALLGTGVTALFLPALAALLAGLAAWRTRCLSALRFLLVVIALAVGGLLATSQVTGILFGWIIRWWWIVACLWWVAIVWCVWSAAMSFVRSADLSRAVTTALAALALLGTLAATRPVVAATRHTPPPGESTSIVTENFLRPVIDALRGKGPVLLESTGSIWGDYSDALRLQLERNGIDVVVPQKDVYKFGPQRSIAERTPNATVWVVNADAIRRFRADPEMTELGGWDPLTPAERARFFADEAVLQSQFVAAGRSDLARAITDGTGNVLEQAADLPGVDQELLARVEAVRRKGDPVAIFIGPPPARG